MRTLSVDRSPTPDVEAFLLRCVDALLAATLFCVPLLMGGRQALGQFVLVVLALGAALGWCLRQACRPQAGWTWSLAEVVLLAAIGLVGLQLVPLPPAAIKALAPRIYELLPLWSPDAAPATRLGVWSCLSLTPVETCGGLSVLVAYALLFLVAVQRIGSLEDVERLLRWVAIAGTGMAALGLLQYLAGNGKFFWFYEHPFSNTSNAVKGSFTNRNHFAHFLVLAIGPLVWWIQRSLVQAPPGRRGRHRRPADLSRRMNANAGFLMAALGLCAFAVLMSLSRGGSAVLFVAGAVILLLLYHGALLDGKTLLFLGGTGLLVVVSLSIYGYHLVSARIDDFQSIEQLDGHGQRRKIWSADLAAARDFLWSGTGVGSHVQVNPIYLPDDQVSQYYKYTHAENGYLQIAMETGIAGLLLAGTGIALVGAWCLAVLRPGISPRAVLCFVGIVPGLVASLLHSLVDFVWYVPGCMVVVVLLAACACRLAQLVRRPDGPGLVVPLPRAAWLLAAPALALLGGLMVPGLFGAVRAEPGWHRASVQWRGLQHREDTERRAELEAMAEELAQAVAWQPRHALAHARLAEVHLQLFHLAQGSAGMDGRQVRDAAVASRFGSRAELDAWLDRAFGPARHHLDRALYHARRAAALCPVHGATYLRLAALTFLQGPQAPDKDRCLEQALLLRPFDGSVLFEAGQEAMLAGDAERAYALWKRSFACGSRHQDRLFRLLAVQLPATFFLETFPIDPLAMKHLETQYRKLQRTDDVKVLLGARARLACQRAEDLQGEEAVETWMEAAKAYWELEEIEACAWCLQHALRGDPSNYDARYLLGTCLFQAKRYAEAEEHLNWCRRRKPHSERLRSMLDTVLTERLRMTRQPAAAGPN